MDALLRAKMRQELLKIQGHFSIPVILITHDPEDVAALARTVVVYEHGRVSKIMSPTKPDHQAREVASLLPLTVNWFSELIDSGNPESIPVITRWTQPLYIFPLISSTASGISRGKTITVYNFLVP